MYLLNAQTEINWVLDKDRIESRLKELGVASGLLEQLEPTSKPDTDPKL